MITNQQLHTEKHHRSKTKLQKAIGMTFSDPNQDRLQRFIPNHAATEKLAESFLQCLLKFSCTKLEPISILAETQTRRLLGTFSKKYRYFSNNEDQHPNKIYASILPQPKESDLKIQNIGHAALLIHTNDFNTDSHRRLTIT